MKIQYRKFIFWGLILLPLILYLVVMLRFTCNVPRADDYDAVLNYLNFTNTDRWHLLFSQHNEHRIVFTRLIAEVMLYITGTINFTYLIYIGNAALFLILLILFHLFKKTNIIIVYFVPIPYILFSILSWENTTWAMASIQNYYVLLFSLLSLFFWEKRLFFIIPSLGFATAATFTSGSGLFVFIVLGLWSLVDLIESFIYGDQNKKRLLPSKKYCIISFFSIIIVASIIFFIYFYNYGRSNSHLSILKVLLNPVNTISYFLIFLGSYMKSKIWAIVVGIISVLLFTYLTSQKYYRKNPIIYYSLFFILLNAIVVALARSGFGQNQAFSSRYCILSLLLLIFLYMAVLENMNPLPRTFNKSFCMILLIAFTFNIVTFIIEIPTVSARHKLLRRSVQKWMVNRSGLIYPNQLRASRIVKKASDNGYYELSSNLVVTDNEESKKVSINTKNLSHNVLYSIDHKLLLSTRYLYINGWAFYKGAQVDQSQKYIVLKSNNKIIVFTTYQQKRPDVTRHFKAKDLAKSGFEAMIPLEKIPQGECQVHILLFEGENNKNMIYTNKNIDISKLWAS